MEHQLLIGRTAHKGYVIIAECSCKNCKKEKWPFSTEFPVRYMTKRKLERDGIRRETVNRLNVFEKTAGKMTRKGLCVEVRDDFASLVRCFSSSDYL